MKILPALLLIAFAGKAQTKEMLKNHLDSLLQHGVKDMINFQYRLMVKDSILAYKYPPQIIFEVMDELLENKEYVKSYDSNEVITAFLITKRGNNSWDKNKILKDWQAYVNYFLSLSKYGGNLASDGIQLAILGSRKEDYDEIAMNQIRQILQTKLWEDVIKIATKLDLMDQKKRITALRDSLLKTNYSENPQPFFWTNIALARWGDKKSIQIAVDDLRKDYRGYRYTSVIGCQPEIVDELLEISKKGYLLSPPPAGDFPNFKSPENYDIKRAMKEFIKNFPPEREVARFPCFSKEEDAYFKYYFDWVKKNKANIIYNKDAIWSLP